MPEAAPWPRISRDGRTYTFEVRPGFTRFSNRERVGPSSFARALERLADPNADSPARDAIADVVGARAVMEATARRVSGVRVHGTRLSIRLRRPANDFLARLAMPYFCAIARVHPDRPRYPEGPVVSAGPYFIAQADGGRPIVLRRNPHYRGPRARGPATIEVFAESGPAALKRVESGSVDLVGDAELRAGERPTTARLRGTPESGVVALLFNPRPGKPFADVRLRKAAALAVDRVGVAGRRGAPTDMLAPGTIPGLRRSAVYPSRPTESSLKRARELAEGRVPVSVGGRGIPYPHEREFVDSLRAIGIRAGFKRTTDCDQSADFYLAFLPSNHWDLSSVLRVLADDRRKSGCYWPGWFETGWKPRLHRTLALNGAARLRGLAELEAYLVRDRALAVGLYRPTTTWLVSARIGCFRPHRVYQVDIAALCLR
jgi:Bacterial extracellular solute-binding proteins, family 5 Middle